MYEVQVMKAEIQKRYASIAWLYSFLPRTRERRASAGLSFNSCTGGGLVYLFRLLRLYAIFPCCHGTDLSGVRVVFTANRGARGTRTDDLRGPF